MGGGRWQDWSATWIHAAEIECGWAVIGSKHGPSLILSIYAFYGICFGLAEHYRWNDGHKYMSGSHFCILWDFVWLAKHNRSNDGQKYLSGSIVSSEWVFLCPYLFMFCSCLLIYLCVPFSMSAVLLLRNVCPQMACILKGTVWTYRAYYSSGFIVMCKISEDFIKSAIYIQYLLGSSSWKLLDKIGWKEAIAWSSKTQWQNIKTTRENNKNEPRKQAVANFRLNAGHDCLAAHLHRIKILSHNYCTICKLKNATMDKDHHLVCPKLDHTSKELSKLCWDARRLME